MTQTPMQNGPQITCSCDDFKKSNWCKHMPSGVVKTGWNEPQLSVNAMGNYPFKWIKHFYSKGSSYGSEPHNTKGESVVDETLVEVQGTELTTFIATALEEQRNQGLKDALVLAYDLADEKGTLNYGKLHRQVELALLTQKEDK